MMCDNQLLIEKEFTPSDPIPVTVVVREQLQPHSSTMVKYSNESKALINSRFVIIKDEHVCLDCKHTFHDTHYYRKFSHLRNCEHQSEETINIIHMVNASDPFRSDSCAGSTHSSKKRRKDHMIPDNSYMMNLDSINERNAREIADSMVTFFISAGLPFATVETTEFKEFVHALRPAYSPFMPSQGDLEKSYSGAN